MERDPKFILLIGALLAITGCSDSDSTTGAGGSGGAGGSAGTGGQAGEGGAGGDAGTPALAALSATPRYAVVSSDFSSSSIAVLDEDFEIIDESWVNSGTTYPGLVATLSGDVVLPTRQAGDGTLAVVDRFMTDVVTRFYVPSGNLNGQARTQGDVGDSGFSSNPQDFVFVDENSAWATRYQPNLNLSAAPENQGTDLFEIDPRDMSATGARFDLSQFNTTATVVGDSGPEEVEVFARPGRALLVESRILVGLERISANFDAAGTGMVASVDLEGNSALGVGLAELQNCGRVVPVPGAPAKALVGCLGFSFPYGDQAQVRASAGIVLLSVNAAGVVIERLWKTADHPSAAIAVNSVLAIDEDHVLGVGQGDFASTVDTLYMMNLTTGTQEIVHESMGSFVLGDAAYDADSAMLYVPDASANEVIELAGDSDGFTQVGSKAIAPSLGLPPTQVYLLD